MSDPFATLRLAEELIARASVTPADGGCQDVIGARLAALGFALEWIDSGPADARVRNLWAKFDPNRPAAGAKSSDDALQLVASSAPCPTFVFAGHTDVVPTGPVDQWASDPFTPTHRDGVLYGRGACDMKTSLAAFVVAIEEFLAAHPHPRIGLALLLTSDEEGPAVDGTVVVCERLKARGERLDWCIVGEPTSVQRTGDMIKNGRRGSLSGRLTVKGIQAHIAYPHLGRNPIHQVAPALAELAAIEWDAGNAYFPATSWQISNIHGGTGANNVIPGHVVVDFNFRFSTESTAPGLRERLEAVLQRHGLDYAIEWTLSGEPFLTTPGALLGAVEAAILAETGLRTELSTTGGTSDGRFIAKICPQTIEFGPPNATIHKIDECIRVSDVEPLKNIYRRVLETLDARTSTPA